MSKLKSINPATDEVLGEVEISSDEEILDAVREAKLAARDWKDLGLEQRLEHLRKLVVIFKSNKDELATLATKEMGMPITQTREDIDFSLNYFNWYLDHANEYLSPEIVQQDDNSILKVFYEPFGVAAVITPWNFPLSNFIWGAGQALIAGNTVVYKCSEETVLFGKKLAELAKQAELPEGVCSFLFGDGGVGDKLIHQDVNLISFTGSSLVGKYIYKVAGEKFVKCVVEMGGSAPGIICSDAKLDEILETVYSCRFSNCGQMCDALKRLLVHESKFDEVVEKLKQLLQSKKVGDPMDETTDIGPLVSERQLQLLDEQVEDALDKGAKVITGGKRVDGPGNFYQPTILTGITPEMRVWQEEVFGPVLPIKKFSEDEQAVVLANDTSYGLGAYLFTQDLDKAQKVAEKLQTGMVAINNTNYVHPASPFGGYKDSGMGREHGKFGFSELTQVKVVSIPKN